MSKDKPKGWDDLVAWFGEELDFLDTEVERIELCRHPEPCVVDIHAWVYSAPLKKGGAPLTKKHCTVRFTFSLVEGQEMKWWSHQNVLHAAWVERDGEFWQLFLEGEHGVDARFRARQMTVSVSPREDGRGQAADGLLRLGGPEPLVWPTDDV